MKTTRKISSEQQFNSSQPCASDMHNGCDKCEPKSDTIEVPAQLVRDIISLSDACMGIDEQIDKLEALLKEQSK